MYGATVSENSGQNAIEPDVFQVMLFVYIFRRFCICHDDLGKLEK